MKKRFLSILLSLLFILCSFSTSGVLAVNTDDAGIICETQSDIEPKILKEDVTKRGIYEKHFVCDDGTYIATTYPEQVCYKDTNGNWVEIDNTLSEKDGRIENNNSEMKASFAKIADDKELVKLNYDNSELAWDLEFYKKNETYKNANTDSTDSFEKNSTVKQEEKTETNRSIASYTTSDKLERNTLSDNEQFVLADNIESKIVYQDICSDNIDVEYTVLPNRVKENVVINEKSDIACYSMNVACRDLTASINNENSIEFKDNSGTTKYYIQTPYMFDDIYELSYDIDINIKETADGYTITFYPDLNWLNDKERVYPIIIDPTVKTNTTKSNFSDTYIYEGSTASQSRALEERLRVGIYNSKVYRALWKVETLPTIPKYAAINSATFKLKLPDVTNTSRVFSLYKLNSSWASYTVTWSQANSLSKTLLSSNVARNSSNDTLTFSGTKLTSAVKSWYTGTANNGFLIRYTSEATSNPDYNVFYSSDNTTSTSYMPLLSIAYSYGAAKAYRNVTSTIPRCLSYAFYYDTAIFIDINETDTVSTTFNRLKNKMQSSPYNRTIRKLGSNDRINSNEYLIVMRIGSHYVQGIKLTDYHFMVQTNTGGWAHKPGQRASQNLGNINPSSYNWSYGNKSDSYYYANFYNSSPIYFATNVI